jgi:hypothetical protein
MAMAKQEFRTIYLFFLPVLRVSDNPFSNQPFCFDINAEQEGLIFAPKERR